MKIRDAVLLFCRVRVESADPTFSMSELALFVEGNVRGKVAPESAGRVFRDLANARVIEYEQLSRSKSRYRLLRVIGKTAKETAAKEPSRATTKRWYRGLVQTLSLAYEKGVVPEDSVLELKDWLKKEAGRS